MSRAPDLDLHPYFRDPKKALAVLDACIADNVMQGRSLIRVVHGKGSGTLRETVHRHLEKHPDVAGFVLCDSLNGGEGATWVHLRAGAAPADEQSSEQLDRPSLAVPWRFLAYFLLLLVLYSWADWKLLAAAVAGIALLELVSARTRDPG